MERHPRLRLLPGRVLPGGVLLITADSTVARLVGLAGLDALPPGHALWLPRCRSVHTIGMRFALDLLWLDAAGRVVRQDAGVPPQRLVACRSARSVVETSVGMGERVAAAVEGAQLR